MTAGAVSLKKSHDIVILSFCNIVKGQANCTTNLVNHLLFLHSDDIIRLLEQNGRLLHKFFHFVLMISLDLTKSSEVRKAGDQSNGRGLSRK